MNTARSADIARTIPSLQTDKTSSADDLAYLRQQLAEAQNQLRSLYQVGNDVNTQVMLAQQNVNAAQARLYAEDEIVKNGTMNLEKARAE